VDAAGLCDGSSGGEEGAIEMVGVQMVESIAGFDGKVLTREGGSKGPSCAIELGPKNWTTS